MSCTIFSVFSYFFIKFFLFGKFFRLNNLIITFLWFFITFFLVFVRNFSTQLLKVFLFILHVFDGFHQQLNFSFKSGIILSRQFKLFSSLHMFSLDINALIIFLLQLLFHCHGSLFQWCELCLVIQLHFLKSILSIFQITALAFIFVL